MDITPLGLACGRGRQDIVDMLLAKGANINMSSEVNYILIVVAFYLFHVSLGG